MIQQYDLFPSGESLRDAGIKLAKDHANDKEPNWSDKCYALLLKYVYLVQEFKCENFRDYCKGKIEQPPHLRAYGSIILRAAKLGLIKRIGYAQVNNPLAHKANCSLWVPVVNN